MIAPIHAPLFRVFYPAYTDGVYTHDDHIDYTREEALELMKTQYRSSGKSIPKDEDELMWDFFASYFPVPLDRTEKLIYTDAMDRTEEEDDDADESRG